MRHSLFTTIPFFEFLPSSNCVCSPALSFVRNAFTLMEKALVKAGAVKYKERDGCCQPACRFTFSHSRSSGCREAVRDFPANSLQFSRSIDLQRVSEIAFAPFRNCWQRRRAFILRGGKKKKKSNSGRGFFSFSSPQKRKEKNSMRHETRGRSQFPSLELALSSAGQQQQAQTSVEIKVERGAAA